MPRPPSSPFDVLADLAKIQKIGIEISDTLANSLAVICHSKGVSINMIAASILWDYVHDYNNNMREKLLEYQDETSKTIFKNPEIALPPSPPPRSSTVSTTRKKRLTRITASQ